jgi:hypothetical protein
MSVVIVDPELGIFVGCAMGLGFFTLADTVGQGCVVTFPDEDAAREFMAHMHVDTRRFIIVDGFRSNYAYPPELREKGLGHLLGELERNLEIILDMKQPMGQA